MASTAPPRPARRQASISSTPARASIKDKYKEQDDSTSTPANSSSKTTLEAKGTGKAAPLEAKGAGSARSTPSPKAIPPVRRANTLSRPNSSLSAGKGRESPSPNPGGVKKENGIVVEEPKEEKEGERDELRLRIQDLDSTVSNLANENAKLQTSLTQAESRLSEYYTEQSRMDQELGVRMELAEKLRAQLREFEKEKRELTKRYQDQTSAFEAERQSFYDNEQHLKSRIQALSRPRRDTITIKSPRNSRHSDADDAASIVSEIEFPPREPQSEPQASQSKENQIQEEENDDNDPAEMTALKLELSTLSTSHNSLQSTLHVLQTQLLDLQRVNAEVQEENEGWKVLVQQRTLAGQFDILGLGGAREEKGDDASSMKSGRQTLDKVSEADELAYEAEAQSGQINGVDMPVALLRGRSLEEELSASDPVREGSPVSKNSRRRGRGLGSISESPKGETLADLPITGPGLDLAAELGRAQNAEGFIDGGVTGGQPKKQQTATEVKMQKDIDDLKTEVKALKDANKALSLYASKIIDRIIATEGFENVLAVDFTVKFEDQKKKQRRPANMIFNNHGGKIEEGPKTAVPKEKLTTFESIRASQSSSSSSSTGPPPPPKPAPPPAADDAKRSRRSMSFDWRGFSLFGGGAQPEEKKPDPSLRPLTLRPGAPALTQPGPSMQGARKLETVEDEEDRKERERLRTTMRLMGIDPSTQSPPQVPPKAESIVSESGPNTATPSNNSNRWSLFGRKPANGSASTSSTSLVPSGSVSPMPPPANLTAEALQQAEAETHLAALDAREKVVKEEIAKGGGSGFTELAGLNGGARRKIGEEWRSRRSSASFGYGELGQASGRYRERKEGSSTGSGRDASTVWSAGEDDD